MERENQSPNMFSGFEPQEQDIVKEDPRRFKANSNFLLREVAGEAILIPVGEAGVFENSVLSLNDTCRFLWQTFQQPTTVAQAIDAAKKEYLDPDGEMEQGIIDFVREYLKYGLLKED